MKLISMTNFVLEQSKLKFTNSGGWDEARWYNSLKYANFLKQLITLGMFVPCDDDGNVLEEITSFDPDISSQYYSAQIYQNQLFQEAKQKVLFNGFFVKAENDNWHSVTVDVEELIVFTRFGKDNIFSKSHNYQTIEDLIPYDLDLAVFF